LAKVVLWGRRRRRAKVKVSRQNFLVIDHMRYKIKEERLKRKGEREKRKEKRSNKVAERRHFCRQGSETPD
jgi:hypothetical protein